MAVMSAPARRVGPRWTVAPAVLLALLAAVAGCLRRPGPSPLPYSVVETPLTVLSADLATGRVSSRELVDRYLARIAELDQKGPALRSIIAVNPRAVDDAVRLDRERAAGAVRGPLHGIPVAIKDNIESLEPLPTTAGSLALERNVTGRDAPLVARLRAAGAIIVAKTNLSEWANFRSTTSTSGWSAMGGLVRNPYALDRNACGSSSGSGAAVAASLVAAAVGTETDGSITCPAAINGLVGLKPTVGLVSRRHIVPISAAQDTAGPMARTVADAAALLAAMAGADPQDPDTRDADARRADYPAALSAGALRGARLGVLRFAMGYDARVDGLFEDALLPLRAQGATLVDLPSFPALRQIDRDELRILLTDFRLAINAYLATTPPSVATRTLADLIAFNRTHAEREMPHFQQELFEQAEATARHDPAEYRAFRAGVKAAAAAGLDGLLATHRLDALIAPTTGPAWPTDLARGDRIGGSAGTLPAVAGYPHLTVPMGFIDGLPVGLSFIGPRWSEARLLALGFAFEQHTLARRPPPLLAPPPAPASPSR